MNHLMRSVEVRDGRPVHEPRLGGEVIGYLKVVFSTLEMELSRAH